MKRIWIMLAAVLLITTPVAAQSPTTPYPGPARIIGSDSAGCIAGAVRLPDTAPGMQTIRVSRSTFWGHPTVIAALQDLARRAQAAGLPDLYMNDISLPRGGPLVGIHASHQRGVDADVWLDVAGPHPVLPIAQRETITPHTLVRPDGRGVDMTIWRPEHITLIRLAATEPGIDRVLVNPAIMHPSHRRALLVAAGSSLVWPRDAYASAFQMPRRANRMHRPTPTARGRWLRCLAGLVVRTTR